MYLVRHWMKHPVRTIRPKDSLQHARALLEEHRINQLPVVVRDKVVGVITDRDLRDAFPSVFEMAALKKKPAVADPDTVTVESVMTHRVVSVTPTDTIADAARLLRKERIGALPVLEGGKLVGILTRSDLLDALATIVSAEPEETP